MEFTDSTGRMFRTEEINPPWFERRLKMSEDARDLMHSPAQPQATRIVDANIKVQSGPPPFETRKGGPSGRSKYQPLFDRINASVDDGSLAPEEGWIEVKGNEKDLAHLRTALKRQGLFNPDVLKVSHLDGAKTNIAVFIPKGSDMAKLKLEPEA